MSIRFETKGSDNWNRRPGYQRTMRVPGPILPMEPAKQTGLLQRLRQKII